MQIWQFQWLLGNTTVEVENESNDALRNVGNLGAVRPMHDACRGGGRRLAVVNLLVNTRVPWNAGLSVTWLGTCMEEVRKCAHRATVVALSPVCMKLRKFCVMVSNIIESKPSEFLSSESLLDRCRQIVKWTNIVLTIFIVVPCDRPGYINY